MGLTRSDTTNFVPSTIWPISRPYSPLPNPKSLIPIHPSLTPSAPRLHPAATGHSLSLPLVTPTLLLTAGPPLHFPRRLSSERRWRLAGAQPRAVNGASTFQRARATSGKGRGGGRQPARGAAGAGSRDARRRTVAGWGPGRATTDGSKRAVEGRDRQAGGCGGLGSARARRADRAYRAGPTRLPADRVVSGFEARHAVPARYDTTN